MNQATLSKSHVLPCCQGAEDGGQGFFRASAGETGGGLLAKMSQYTYGLVFSV